MIDRRATRARLKTIARSIQPEHDFRKESRNNFRTTGKRTMDDIKIKLSIEFSITESDLEDGLAEYDELSVDSLIAQILDCKVVTGPNNLEEVDELRAASNAG
jgi:hypothetical protein